MKQNNRKIGTEYEELAASYLEKKGYFILERNYRNGKNSEIDIISRDKETIVFVEVKYRKTSNSGYPLESVNLSKQKRISEAARRYIYSNNLSLEQSYRFDVIGILGENIEHIENAFCYIGR